MPPSIKISVIIPVLNNRSGFVNAYQSVVKQAYNAIEIIVIDGGSTDGTVDAIKEFKNIAYWESGKDSGICDAFNRGISHASGDLIAILNSDDCWEVDTVKVLLETIKKIPDAGIYHGSLRYIDKANNYSYVRHPDINAIKKRMTVFHPTMFVRREVYERIGLYDDRYSHAMDSEWCHRAVVNNITFHQVPRIMANMALGGLSDINYVQSLYEYRCSLIEHKIATPMTANFNFIMYLMLKGIMRFKWLQPIKRIRDKFH